MKQRLTHVDLRQQLDRVVRELRRGRRSPGAGRRPGPGARPATPARASGAIHGNDASIVAGVSRTPGRISRAKRARRRERRVQLVERRVRPLEHARAAARSSARRLSSSAANAAIVRLKFVTKSLSCSSLGGERARRRALWPMISFDRSCSSVPSIASLTIAMPAQRVGARLERVVQRLGRRLALRSSAPGRRPRPAAARRRARRRSPGAASGGPRACRSGATSAPGRAAPGPRSAPPGSCRPSSSSGARRRARVELDEEVALEEDARPDLQLGVLVDRQRRRP